MACFEKYFPVTQDQKEAILSGYGKTQDSIKEDVKVLREWLKKQPHIPEIKDDSFLESIFLRNKCRIEKTKIKIDNYFTSKHAHADFYESLDPCNEQIVKASKYHYITCMPKLTPKNERILFITKDLPYEDAYDSNSSIKMLGLLTEVQLLYDYTDSIVLIVDTYKNSISQMSKFEFALFRKVIKIYYEAFSGRLSQLHIINSTPAIDIVANIAKQVLPKQIGDRMKFHPKGEAILEYFPKECLPNEVGGIGGSIQEISMNFMKTLQENRDDILKRNKTKTNESLRVGKPYIEVDLYGVEGSFKKINLD